MAAILNGAFDSMSKTVHPANSRTLILWGGVLAAICVVGTVAVAMRVRSLASTPVAAAAKSMKAGNLEIGATMPDIAFTAADGARHQLSEFLGAKPFTAVTFTHPDCPCAASCGKLIAEMGREGYDDVQVIGILPVDWDNKRVLTALDEQRAEGVVTYPVYQDRDGSARKLLGATRTPEMWLLDREGKVVFYGAPENTLFPGSPGHRFLLREAVDALRAGRRPEVETYKPIGCAIEGA